MAQSHYETLGVPEDADARTIKKAYFTKVRLVPPETHPEEFKALREAYEVLSDADARKHYDDSRGASYAAFGTEGAAVMLSAVEAMGEERYDRAIPLFEAVLRDHPDADEARLRLMSCLMSAQKFEAAEVQAREFSRRFPDRVEGPLFVGYSFREREQWPEARAAFVDAALRAPSDVRPVRAVIGIDVDASAFVRALEFVDERLAASKEADFTFILRCERVSLLHQNRDARKANAELDALQAEVLAQPEPERRDEFAYFLEREAAQHLSRQQGGRAAELLKRAGVVAPAREGKVWLEPATVRVDELPAASREWLLQQRTSPEFATVPGRGPWADLLYAGLLSMPAGLLLLAALESASWATSSVAIVLGLFTAVGLAAFRLARRAYRKFRSPLGEFLTIHPLYLLEVQLDRVRALPLVGLTQVNSTHHHQNGGYTHTQIQLSFTGETKTLSVSPHSFGEELHGLLQSIRNRLLNLLHSGMLDAERGVDFVPPELMRRGRPPFELREWRPMLIAAALLALVVPIAASWSTYRADELQWERAQADGGPNNVRQYLYTFAKGRHVVEAKALLQHRHDVLVEKLATGWPRLAAELKPADPMGAPTVQVIIEGTSRFPTFKASSVVDVPDRLAALPAREAGLLTHLQAAVDHIGGAGWVKLKLVRPNEPNANLRVVANVTYEVALTGEVFALTRKHERASDRLWHAPTLTGSIRLGETAVPLRTTATGLAVGAGSVATLKTGNAEQLYELVFDAMWSDFNRGAVKAFSGT